MTFEVAKETVQELSITELLELQTFIEEVIQVKKDGAINEALLPLQNLADQLGLSLVDILDKKKTKKTTRKPKDQLEVTHRSKDDPSLTWSGRGNRPKWLREELEKGKSIDDFKI